MAQEKDDFSGIWYCAYRYPSNTHDGEDISEYYVQVHHKDNLLVLTSLPNREQSYIQARLTVDGDLATGTWLENTSPNGEFEGSMYSGAMQLLITADNNRMQGRWVGVGQEQGKRQIYTGSWELSRAGAGKQGMIDQPAALSVKKS